jgi:hypothetical protein
VLAEAGGGPGDGPLHHAGSLALALDAAGEGGGGDGLGLAQTLGEVVGEAAREVEAILGGGGVGEALGAQDQRISTPRKR